MADPTDSLTAFDQLIGVDRDFVATRVSHNLGLTGPAMTLQTACSTSLVTIHAAVQSLLAYECSMALAGGVSINLRQGIGYVLPAGHDPVPGGGVPGLRRRGGGHHPGGNGVAMVALRRLADAEADNDTILAVVRATAINNDGSAKIGFTAPSEDGQASRHRHRPRAGRDPRATRSTMSRRTAPAPSSATRSKIAALTRAFRPGTDRTQFCGVGSAKTSVGHTDAAAGVTGFIKTVLALQHGELPPSLHFDEPNPSHRLRQQPVLRQPRATSPGPRPTPPAGPGSARSASAAPTPTPCWRRPRRPPPQPSPSGPRSWWSRVARRAPPTNVWPTSAPVPGPTPWAMWPHPGRGPTSLRPPPGHRGGARPVRRPLDRGHHRR